MAKKMKTQLPINPGPNQAWRLGVTKEIANRINLTKETSTNYLKSIPTPNNNTQGEETTNYYEILDDDEDDITIKLSNTTEATEIRKDTNTRNIVKQPQSKLWGREFDSQSRQHCQLEKKRGKAWSKRTI